MQRISGSGVSSEMTITTQQEVINNDIFILLFQSFRKTQSDKLIILTLTKKYVKGSKFFNINNLT